MTQPQTPHETETDAETRRTLHLCNICGFCTGLCAVFRSAERRPALTQADLDHLAHLCHNCRACWYACQYAPPHAFAINVPATLARHRARSYRRYAWPRPLAGLLARSGTATTAVALFTTLLVPLLTLLWVPGEVLFAAHRAEGAFYRVIPWGLMSAVAVLTLGFSLLAVTMGLIRYWRDIGRGGPPAVSVWRALPTAARDLFTLRNLEGGGGGCNDRGERPGHTRRRLHHALFYGFLLCLAATIVAAGYHHFLHWQAPYPFFSLPTLLGTVGGLSMITGAAGMIRLKRGADPAPTAAETLPADYALLGLLLATAATGLLLLALRETPAMGLTLALHLGTVLGFFVMIPYSKFVHGAYRAASLLRAAMERPTDRPTGLDLT